MLINHADRIPAAAENRRRFGRLIGWASALGVAILLPLIADSYQIHILVMVGIYSIFGTGYNLCLGHLGMLSLGHNSFIGIGAYSAVLAVEHFGISSGLSLVASVMVGLIGGAIFGLIALQLRGGGFVIATLAIGSGLQLIAVNWDSVTEGPAGITDVETLTVAGLQVVDAEHFYYLTLAALIISLLVCMALSRTRAGRAWTGIRENEGLAASVGIDTQNYSLLAITISGAIIAIGGGIMGYYQLYVSPDLMSFQQVLLLLMVVVIGGIGIWAGPILGAAVVITLQEYLRAFDPWQYPILGVVLVVVVFIKPGGLYEVASVDVRRLGKRIRELLKQDVEEVDTRADGTSHIDQYGTGSVYTEEDYENRTAGALDEQNDGDANDFVDGFTDEEVTPVERDEGVALDVSGLSKRYGGVYAVNDVRFEVLYEEILSLIGPNGAGKSTTFDMINGALAPDDGTVNLDAKRLTGLKRYQVAKMGVVGSSQKTEVFGPTSVMECIRIGAHRRFDKHNRVGWLQGRHTRSTDVALRRILRVVGLEHVADSPGNQLAYGEQRRLGVAIALAAGPKVLLLDEPLAGLNDAEVEDMLSLIRKLRAQGMTILLIDHNLKAVMRVSERIVVLDHGEVIANGIPANVARDPRVVESYIGA